MSTKTISPASIPRNEDNAVVVDVRTPAEFSEMHAPGSVLVPLHALDVQRVKGAMAGKTACYLMCQSGGRAIQAAARLKAAGLDNLFVVEGGIEAWQAAGLPVNRGRATMSLERQVRIAAGFLVFLGATLTYLAGIGWILLPAFVGAGLMFAGITNTCGMGMILARMPWNNRVPECRTR